MNKTIVAKTFVINSKGLILVLLRSKEDEIRPSTWDLPGGSVEDGEDPTIAAIREAEEEAGIVIKNPQVFTTKTTNNPDYVIRLLYYTFAGSEDIKLSTEHNQYKWVTKDEFSTLNIPEYYKEFLSKLPDSTTN